MYVVPRVVNLMPGFDSKLGHYSSDSRYFSVGFRKFCSTDGIMSAVLHVLFFMSRFDFKLRHYNSN